MTDPNTNADTPVNTRTCSASLCGAFYKKTFFTCQCVATLLVVLLPLFVTNTPSHGAARKVCYDRTFAWGNVTSFDVDSPIYDPEWDMSDAAAWNLFPVHLFNSISTVVSLLGFWVWLFFSPHMSEVARDLDRKCANFNCISVLAQNPTTFHLPRAS